MEGHQPMINAKPATTFVHVDTVTFREVVQRLTGHTDNQMTTTTTITSCKNNDKIPPSVNKASAATTSKLHERRRYSTTKAKLEIAKPKLHYTCAHISPSLPAGENLRIPSPVTPSTLFSKLTMLEQEQKRESIEVEKEEKAIKERRFYLHPSPRSKPGFVEPELLDLFPLTSPKTEGYTTPRVQ